MVKHIVTFRFNGTPAVREEISSRFRDALLALPEQIDILRSIEVGININPAENWDMTLIATVDKLEDVASYSAHPAHKAAVEIIAPYKLERACVDYVAE